MLCHYGIRPWDLPLFRKGEVTRIEADLEVREQATAALLSLVGVVPAGGAAAPAADGPRRVHQGLREFIRRGRT